MLEIISGANPIKLILVLLGLNWITVAYLVGSFIGLTAGEDFSIF